MHSHGFKTIPLTNEFLTSLRLWVNTGKGRVLLDNLAELRQHFDTLVNFISNMGIIADSEKQSHDQSLYATNSTRLQLFGIELYEQAQDSMKIFETQEAIQKFQAAQTILNELLAEMQRVEMLQAADEERKDSSGSSSES